MIFILVLMVPFVLYAVADMYVCYRMIRKPEIDRTAGVLWFWCLKWAFGSQTRRMAEILPWLSQDLTEALGIRPDDGEIS